MMQRKIAARPAMSRDSRIQNNITHPCPSCGSLVALDPTRSGAMPTVRFRILASEDDTQDVIHHVENINEDIERVEEVADLMQHRDDSDSSSSGLCEDIGSGFH